MCEYGVFRVPVWYVAVPDGLLRDVSCLSFRLCSESRYSNEVDHHVQCNAVLTSPSTLVTLLPFVSRNLYCNGATRYVVCHGLPCPGHFTRCLRPGLDGYLALWQASKTNVLVRCILGWPFFQPKCLRNLCKRRITTYRGTCRIWSGRDGGVSPIMPLGQTYAWTSRSP